VRPVEPDARRLACPDRRRLVGVKRSLTRRIVNPDVLSDALLREAGRRRHTLDTTRAAVQHRSQCDRRASLGALSRGPCWLKAVSSDESEQIPPGGSDHIRVSRRIGWKTRKVRSTSAGVGSARRGDTRARTWRSGSAIERKTRRRIAQPQKARKGLPVSFDGDGAEPRKVGVDG